MGFLGFLKGGSNQSKKYPKTSSKELHQQSMKLFKEALELHDNNEEFFHIRQESARLKLISHQNRSSKPLRILAGNTRYQSCEVCRQNNGKILTAEEALETMPIPHKECKHNPNENGEGWCRCSYVTHIDINKLIRCKNGRRKTDGIQ